VRYAREVKHFYQRKRTRPHAMVAIKQWRISLPGPVTTCCGLRCRW
jgi:hypothetical protein